MAQVKTEHRKGEPSKAACREICRYYINGKGQCEVTGFEMDVITELERNGFTGDLYGLAPLTMFKAILRDNRYETLLKSGRTDHFRHFMMHSTDLEICWDSYKIAKRNHYHIGSINLWCDTIRMLSKVGKDIRNAHYICPTDLQAAHDKLVKKIDEQAERERRAEDMERASKNEAEFKAMKGKFFGLLFTDGLINVRVLESVEEHRQEGSHMHHCVFSASYYLNEESLIFSATIRSTSGRFARRRTGNGWRQWSSALTSSEWCRAEVSATRTPSITTVS